MPRVGRAGDFELGRLVDLERLEMRPSVEADRRARRYVGLVVRPGSLVGLVRRHPHAADALLAAALAALAELEIWLADSPAVPRGVLAVGGLLAMLSLAWRRRAPLASAVVTLGVIGAQSLFGVLDGVWWGLGFLLALYSVAAHCEPRGALVGLALGLVSGALQTLAESNDSIADFLSNYSFIAVVVIGIPWVAGRALRGRQLRAEALEDRAAALQRESEERARAAVAEERLRTARELHDVVGHSLGVIVVQAGAERATLATGQESTRDTLVTIERIGREALSEMRRLLDLMRRDDEQVALAPQPSLAHLDSLFESVRSAGLPVELRVEGEQVSLPSGIDLSAYRILQEALTNALKHAGPARARVTVRYAPDGVELEIVDDGPGPGTGGDGGGHGLVGMGERVALYGGTLRTGTRPGGGYAVSARLPFEVPRG
jgi:signal transduction histidine kinase